MNIRTQKKSATKYNFTTPHPFTKGDLEISYLVVNLSKYMHYSYDDQQIAFTHVNINSNV